MFSMLPELRWIDALVGIRAEAQKENGTELDNGSLAAIRQQQQQQKFPDTQNLART